MRIMDLRQLEYFLRAAATGGRSGREPMLEPGEIRRYEIRISVDEHR
jgi:hypothetical protein